MEKTNMKKEPQVGFSAQVERPLADMYFSKSDGQRIFHQDWRTLLYEPRSLTMFFVGVLSMAPLID